MNIFHKIAGAVIGPIIRKEIMKVIKEFIQPILDLIKTLVQPEKGTKFLITLAVVGSVAYLHKAGIATTSSDLGLVALAIAYYGFDTFHKLKKDGGGK